MGQSRIVNGEIVDIEDVPYYVAMLNQGEFGCGGSIIGKQWVLTAAHCVNVSFKVWKIISCNKSLFYLKKY